MTTDSASRSYTTRGQRGFTALVLAGLLALLLTPLVRADNVVNDIVAGVSDTTVIANGTDFISVGYQIRATNDGRTDSGGNKCNVSDGTPGTINISVPSGVSASATALTFTQCESPQYVTFTASAVGSYSITVPSVADGGGDVYTTSLAAFTLTAVAPPNTAPDVSVTGVVDGASYEYGAVPAPGCWVVDAEDGSFAVDAVLSAISGDYAAYGLGSQTASCEYTDESGEYASASGTYSIVDTTAPALTLPSNQTAEATDSSGAAVAFTASAEDAVFGAVDVLCDATSGATFPLGSTTVSCSAADPLGNPASGSFTVTVEDTQGPDVEQLDDITAEATGPSGAVVSFDDPAATDTVEGTVDVLCAPASGSTFGFGETTVTCSAEDSLGNEGSSTFTVTVRDSTGPVLNLPDDITEEATSGNGAVVEFTVSADDAVDGDLEVECDYASGDTFAIGSTTVSCSATDNRGNTSDDSFSITVEDTTAPQVTVPANKTVAAVNASGAAVTFADEVFALDAVDGAVAVDCTPASDSTFALGTTTIICEAVDEAGNEGSTSFTITVSDQTVPVLTLPANITAEATGANGAIITYEASATDNVDESVTVSCLPTAGIFALGTTTVACSATDAAGNLASGSFTVTVVDTTAPALTLPANITAEATSADGAVVSFTASAEDIVRGDVDVLCSPASGSTFALGTTTVSCSAEDAAGNEASGSFTVTVVDTIAPALTLPADIIAGATSADGAVVSFTASAKDIVRGDVDVLCSPASGSTFALGTTTVSCSAEDAAGNSATGSFTVTITPGYTPTGEDVTVTPLGGNGVTLTFDEITAAGETSVTVVAAEDAPALPTGFTLDGATFYDIHTEASFEGTVLVCLPYDPALTNPKLLHYVDGAWEDITTSVDADSGTICGRTGSFSLFAVANLDVTPPVLTLPADIIAGATSADGAVVSFTASAEDIVSGDVDVLCSPASGSTFALGTTTVTCSATDAAGNSATGRFTVTVQDTTAPTGITFVGSIADGASYVYGSVPAAPTCTATDSASGLKSCVVTGYSTTVGTHRLTATATDNAGNVGTATRTYSVAAWKSNGFFSPVDYGKANTVKGGSVVPLKFEVFAGGVEVKDASLVKVVITQNTGCSGLSTDEVEILASTSSALRFDATSDQFIMNWKTPTGNGCYTATITTADGTVIAGADGTTPLAVAIFQTRK